VSLGTALLHAMAYTGVGAGILVLGFFALDLLVPGRLAEHIWSGRCTNAAVVGASGLLGQGAIVFTAIWSNGGGLGSGLAWTAAFGVAGILMMVVAFVGLDVMTPGRLGEIVSAPEPHPAVLVTAASQLAVAAIICASIA